MDTALEFFSTVEGLPYGYHNFLYGWIDSAEGNYPPMLPKQLTPVAFSLVEKIAPDTAFKMFTAGLNLRLETTEDVDIATIAAMAAEQNMGVDDIMAMPEQDGWMYHGEEPRDGRSYVCSAFTTAMYKAAGMFDDMEINATEFTPMDAVNLNFFDTERPRPQACIDANPDTPFCQLLGKYTIDMRGIVNIVDPYSHMNEKCTVHWPDYTRDDNC